jgi:DNA (cytosine-5)-methyltransferase 1
VVREPSFTFVDLFAGIGGFHAAMSGMGGACLLASEIDSRAARIYEDNWGITPVGDIRDFSTPGRVSLLPRDQKISVLTAGFPCQPFSKSGMQRGMNEERGTLFDHIMYIVEKRHPTVVLLENVRNLAGPRHRHEFQYIIERLRSAGYLVSSTPTVFSPHRINPEFGGRPQIRERLFIAATYAPRASKREPQVLRLPDDALVEPNFKWNINDYLDSRVDSIEALELTKEEVEWLGTWEIFQRKIRQSAQRKLPGFPLWSDEWVKKSNRVKDQQLASVPRWKASFLQSNWDFYQTHKQNIDNWRLRTGVDEFPASRRKFEWQAQDEKSIWNCAVHLRPSGIRVKRLTYLPALVAMNQTSIICPLRRRLSPTEAARLQGLPENFDFGNQAIASTYKQLGNGVNVGVVWQVMRAHVTRDRDLIADRDPSLVDAVLKSAKSPDNK